jgi:hypothetical protein
VLLDEAVRLTRAQASERAAVPVTVRVEQVVSVSTPNAKGVRKFETDTLHTFDVPRDCLCYDQRPDPSNASWIYFTRSDTKWPYYCQKLTNAGTAKRVPLLEAAVNFVQHGTLQNWAKENAVAAAILSRFLRSRGCGRGTSLV